MSEAKATSVLEQTVVDVINKSVSSLEKGAEFLAGQLPDIAEQYLKWKFVWACVELVMCVLALFIVFFPLKSWVNSLWEKEKKERTYPDPFPYWFPYSVGAFGICLVLIPRSICNLYAMVQIYIAPKVYLIEWAKSFI